MTDASSTDLTITPDGVCSLAAAASCGFGTSTRRPRPDGNSMSLAFVADDLMHHAAASLTQDAQGVVDCRVFGEADPGQVVDQVRRVLSLDHSGSAWAEVGGRDPVIGRLQTELPGLRPVLFHSPYEAAAWSILSQRRHRTQATAVRKRLSAAHGRVFTLASGDLEAFPTPAALLRLDSFPSLEPQRIDRLHSVARAALEGLLDPAPRHRAGGGDGSAATAPRRRADVRRVDPAAIHRGNRHPHPRRAAPRVLYQPLLRAGHHRY